MKKFLSLALILFMMTSLSVTALAADATNSGGNTTIDVNAIYTGNVSIPDVISIDIAWGEMQFTYNVNGSKDWNAVNHQYVDNVSESWTAKGNDVTVTNHSNVAIKAELSFATESAYDGITGSFGENATLLLDTAVGTAKEAAPSATANLTLSGALASTVTNITKVGTITVKIDKQS